MRRTAVPGARPIARIVRRSVSTFAVCPLRTEAQGKQRCGLGPAANVATDELAETRRSAGGRKKSPSYSAKREVEAGINVGRVTNLSVTGQTEEHSAWSRIWVVEASSSRRQ